MTTKTKRTTISSRHKNALRHGWRSGLETRVAEELEEAGVEYQYETLKIEWHDCNVRTYTPDFILPNGIIVETKGRFTTADRLKHLEVRKQHPTLDIRFVFQNPNIKIRKKSPTSYSMWCDKHGFKWASKSVPQEWIDEE